MTLKNFHAYGRALSFLGISLALTSCDQIKQGLGLERHQPDEFAVVDRPPLSMPPSMALKPPIPASAATKSKATRQKVQDLVLKPPASAYMPPSQAEEDLLTKAGANKSPDNIRHVIDQDSKIKDKRERGLAEDMVFWKDPKPQGDVIDPVAEKERLSPSMTKTPQ